jgi:hypothetical protein
MYLKDLIKIYDNPIKEETCNSILQFAKEKVNFEAAGLILPKGSSQKGVINKNVRDTQNWSPSMFSNSLTEVHWANFLTTLFLKIKNAYVQNLGLRSFPCAGNVDIVFLRYQEQGHYRPHVDDAPEIPRTLSMILLLNDDYEGGTLDIYTPDLSEKMEIEKKKNRLICWPSFFMYPHGVTPVKKGTRYSIVSWIR